MIGVKSYADKAIDAAARNEAALARAQAMLAAHAADKPAGDDADALFAWRREGRDIQDRVDAATEALAFAKAAAERAEAEAAERAAAAANAAEDKRADADKRIIPELDAAIRKVADLRNKLAASVDRTAAYNRNRGNQPLVIDAETRARRVPSRTEPAVYETRDVWRNAAGDTPGAWVPGKDGEWVPAGHEVFTKRQERIEMCAEKFVPGRMPTRYVEALALVDIAGQPL